MKNREVLQGFVNHLIASLLFSFSAVVFFSVKRVAVGFVFLLLALYCIANCAGRWIVSRKKG